MNSNEFKMSILNYISHFSTYDYMAFAWFILIFFVFILLSIIIVKRNIKVSIFILIVSLIMLLIGPFGLKYFLDKTLRPVKSELLMMKKLNFSNTLIVNAQIQNISQKSFSTCKVDILVTKYDNQKIKDFLNRLKPLRKKTISIDEQIDINSTKELRVVFDNYNYIQDVNISIKPTCY